MQRRGFTLIELLVVIVIIGILVAIALPNFIKIKDKAKEAEVKQNCHAIQLALERYSVDAEGSIYPLILMGGDWTDSYVVWQSWVDQQGFEPLNGDILNPDRAAGWVPAARDVGDPLVMDAYLPSYPANPFMKTRSDTILPICEHNSLNAGYLRRYVGGRESNKMYEVFGPDWLITIQTVQGDFWVHHPYNNPPYDTQSNFTKDPTVAGGSWDSPSGNMLLVGNFSYWPRGGHKGSGFALFSAGDPVGYTIAGYGAVRTKGQDVYNRNGNYVGRYRTEPCEHDCRSGGDIYPTDVQCICAGNGNEGQAPNRNQNNGGSDTLLDGVVITLDSGVDKKTGRVDAGVTQTDG